MGNEKAMLCLGCRRPGAHPRARAGAHQIDRAVWPEAMPISLRWHMLFMRAPAKFSWLQAFRYKAFDRPSIDKHPSRFRRCRALGIAFGNMDAFDADPLRQS